MAPAVIKSSMEAMSKRADIHMFQRSVDTVMNNLIKRQNDANGGLPTVAIVLIALVGVLLLFGGFKLYSDARKRRETVV